MHRLLSIIPVLILGCSSRQSEHSTQDEVDSIEMQSYTTQRNETERAEDTVNNIWRHRDRFQIKLPKGQFLDDGIIISQDSLKVGEIALDNEKLLSPMTMKELLDAIQKYSTIKTEETNYGYPFPIKPEEVEKRLVLDSTATHPIKWYYEISEMEWESVNDWGTWNVFSFHTIYKDRITVISFMNKDLKDLSIDKYLPILNSIRFIEK